VFSTAAAVKRFGGLVLLLSEYPSAVRHVLSIGLKLYAVVAKCLELSTVHSARQLVGTDSVTKHVGLLVMP
jgi:hypothetical protein